MQSKATSVDAYLKSLPEERRAVLTATLAAIRKGLDRRFAEGMGYGMVGWHVPHALYPDGYHCNPKLPLPYAGLAAQKNHYALYLFWTYGDDGETKWIEDQWRARGKKLDMGKCCIRFKKLEDLPLDLLTQAFQRMPLDKFVAWYQGKLDPRTKRPVSNRAAAAGRPAKKAARQAVPKKAAPRKAAPKKAAPKKAAKKAGASRAV